MKSCRYQGRMETDGTARCKLDNTRRRADGCNRLRCKRWKVLVGEAVREWLIKHW